MIDHHAVLLACRARLLTLAVCTTGSTTLTAVATGYTRAAGSFLADGFAVGMELTPSGFTDTGRKVIKHVDATSITTYEAVTPDASGSGRTLAVGLPSVVAWENVDVVPATPAPWVRESYLPGPMAKATVGARGLLEVLPQYVLDIHALLGIDAAAINRYIDALITHFAPGQPLTLASGDALVVRSTPAPFATQLRRDESWAVKQVAFPLRYRTPNSR